MRVNEISNAVMEAVAAVMDDEIREAVHYQLAPCTNEEFIREYVRRAPEFEEVLKTEFSIEL